METPSETNLMHSERTMREGSLFAKKYSEISLHRVNMNSVDDLLDEDKQYRKSKTDDDVMSARDQQSYRKQQIIEGLFLDVKKPYRLN